MLSASHARTTAAAGASRLGGHAAAVGAPRRFCGLGSSSSTGAAAARRSKHVARAGWDLGRFAKTVLFFNDPLKLIGGLFSGSSGAQPAGAEGVILPLIKGPPAPAGAADQGVVLVTGATGGVGKRVVQNLLAEGRRVRALVRDVEKARGLLASLPAAPGASLELVAADLTQARTLLPVMFSGVRQLVSCSAVKVQPKEGDADRSKYFQGIKFYDPEIVGDTPESVEHLGMLNLLAAVKQQLGLSAGTPLLLPTPVYAGRWGALDDVVMGQRWCSGEWSAPTTAAGLRVCAAVTGTPPSTWVPTLG